MRRRFVWDPKLNELVEIDPIARAEQHAPMVVPDLPGYQSPVTGLWVEGRKQRREDLKRTGSRPYEGLESERKEAARRVAYHEQAQDRRLEERAREVFYQMPPERRRILEGR